MYRKCVEEEATELIKTFIRRPGPGSRTLLGKRGKAVCVHVTKQRHSSTYSQPQCSIKAIRQHHVLDDSPSGKDLDIH